MKTISFPFTNGPGDPPADWHEVEVYQDAVHIPSLDSGPLAAATEHCIQVPEGHTYSAMFFGVRVINGVQVRSAVAGPKSIIVGAAGSGDVPTPIPGTPYIGE